MPYIIYADIESLIRKIDGCANNPENSSATKIGEQGFARNMQISNPMSTIWAFGHIENKHNLYFGKECIKKFYTSLREHAKNIFDFEKKNVIAITSRCKSMLYLLKKNLKNAI